MIMDDVFYGPRCRREAREGLLDLEGEMEDEELTSHHGGGKDEGGLSFMFIKVGRTWYVRHGLRP